MQSEVTNPSNQQRILADFAAHQKNVASRQAQLQRARHGSFWIWVCFAALIWGEVGAAMFLDLTRLTMKIIFFGVPIVMCLLGFLMIRSIARYREELFLAIIKEEAPESYLHLQKERIISDENRNGA